MVIFKFEFAAKSSVVVQGELLSFLPADEPVQGTAADRQSAGDAAGHTSKMCAFKRRGSLDMKC